MKLTKEQIVLLNDVFDYAYTYLQSGDVIITLNEEERKFVKKVKSKDEWEKIEKLAEVIKEQIEEVKE